MFVILLNGYLLNCETLRDFSQPSLKSVFFILIEKNFTTIFKRIVTHIKFKRIDIDTLEKFQYSFKAPPLQLTDCYCFENSFPKASISHIFVTSNTSSNFIMVIS